MDYSLLLGIEEIKETYGINKEMTALRSTNFETRNSCLKFELMDNKASVNPADSQSLHLR